MCDQCPTKNLTTLTIPEADAEGVVIINGRVFVDYKNLIVGKTLGLMSVLSDPQHEFNQQVQDEGMGMRILLANMLTECESWDALAGVENMLSEVSGE